MKAKLFVTVAVLAQSVGATSIMIDLDLSTPGVQNSITNAVDGQVINFALVATNFSGDIHCFNGIGGDISSRGSISVNYNPVITAGDIVGYTNEGSGRFLGPDASDPSGGPTPIFSVTPGTDVFNAFLSPLAGYTDNVGGFGIEDQASNWDSNRHVISFTQVPGGSIAYTTIFTASVTLSNVAGNTLELFPSGIFENPPTEMGPLGEGLNPSIPFPTIVPATLLQGGEVYLHTESHDFDQCFGLGPGDLVGASISGIPEPSSGLLVGLGTLGILLRRRRS